MRITTFAPNTPAAPLELWGGIECTINRVGDRFHSQLARRTPDQRLEDLERIASLGIRRLRWPLLWEELAPRGPREIDWSVADAQMQRLRELSIRPVVGLVHHGSGPAYTSLVDPRFPELLAGYARAVAERYPWVEAYTPVNEPLTTARFSGLYGHWFPHAREPLAFCQALFHQVRGVAKAMRAVREVNPAAKLIQTEDLGITFSTPALGYQAEFENERRWLPFDLLVGSLDPAGRVWDYLRWAGISEDELLETLAHPCPPDVIGINHYITSSRFLDENTEGYAPDQIGGNGRDTYADVTAVRARGEHFLEPRELLRAAWERYHRPIAITEAHLDCTREEQLRWFGELWSAASAARQENVPVVAVTAWSLLGAYDWDSLLTRPAGHYQTGAFDFRSPEPRPTALAGMLKEVAASGECRHPLLLAPGWWRRDLRFTGRRVRETPPRAFTPRANQGCPMLLITGATGTLGQAFARICELRGLPYRLLSRAEMDIAEPASVRAAMGAFRPWAVINAAGYVRVDEAEQDRERCWRENVRGPETLAAACAAEGIALLTFSSDLVFDGAKGEPYIEHDATAALNVYGQSKAEAERRVASIFPGALLVRTSAFFGPWDAHNFITCILDAVSRGEGTTAADDGAISPTYVPDLVHAALDLLIDRERGIWHLANAGAVTWADFGRTAAEIAGLDSALVRGCPADELRAPAPRPVWSALATERGQILASWEDGLHRYFRDRDEARPAQPCQGAAEVAAYL